MLPRKTGKPIAIKCTEQFRKQTEAIADSLGKSLSDYCRIAIENYNKHYQQHSPVDSTHKNNTIEQQNVCSICGIINGGHTGGCPRHKNNTASKPEEHLHNVEVKKNTLQKSKMVQSFMKGGK
jgi:hypothetical protein